MYLRIYFLPRAIFIRIGRSKDNYRNIGIAPFRPHFITWKTRILRPYAPMGRVPFYF